MDKAKLQAELNKVKSAIQWIQKNPPTMDYLVEFCHETERLAKLRKRESALETLLNQTEEELAI